ncbi:5-amino-6-(D-ribitylamino)uracil--L-tyrosine 4-hydroxyphenyl transferase CofH [Thauera butanivorans]|uniref:5-amino-6-(D-ribitylamino)uracil--L-tyrosine 4-hydroxyphenyl transferase CofH n=1 Tax=Thauera butanivorans TaxID=86174 RepID=UPI00083810A7|nr:5-amino-6-(D-ribitylamino)uracil--L-tyrosine 4-hydroxyphenyl transferase CofH [Thauera butanivorans]
MSDRVLSLLSHARGGGMLSDGDIHLLAGQAPLASLLGTAEAMTLAGHGRNVGYSRKVFIPLTRLCRNTCGYCTFATTPGRVPGAYLSADEVLAIARAGVAAGCHEALFTLGERPESRYRAARDALAALGHGSTIGYLAEMAALVRRETGLLPHVNPGTMSADEIALLRPVSASMGIMLESSSERLCQRGGPHWKCEDKQPGVRLDTLRRAGELGVPMTTGILIGIGETRRERIDSLLALRGLHRQYGHLQEIIVQNFRAKPGTVMAQAQEPALDDHAWTIAMARLVFGAPMSIQAPPNLRPGELAALLRAGINDWGGISPVTLDHVNPEAAWPQIDALAAETALHGRQLRPRLPLVPSYVREATRWVPAPIATALLRRADASGFARPDDWLAGTGMPPSSAALQPFARRAAAAASPVSAPLRAAIERAEQGRTLDEDDIVRLFDAHGEELHAVIDSADRLRRQTVGEAVSHVRNCNINYTNICQHRCGFCAFAKSHAASTLRGPAYRLDAAQVAARAEEAWLRGATEVCMQGGIHPHYTGDSYLELLAAVKQATPAMHIHAFSPLEIRHGAATLGLSLRDYLVRLRDAGLRTLPGTAAEILDDEVRARICADKLDTAQWLEVMEIAHEVGIRSTATIMFGHVEAPRHWARHLLAIRALQARTGGFTEFVPLPFVHMESPLWHKGGARSGPTLREAVLMHAVARLVLHPLIPNIQTSWVKMGADGAALCLRAGANDLGGTLMYESITRAAGGANGQSMESGDLRAIAASCGRPLRQRSTLYEVLEPDAAAAGAPRTNCAIPPPESAARRVIALHSSA